MSLNRTCYQLFPQLPYEQHEALSNSIRNHGVESPTIWDDENNLLDGWERETICEMQGLRCPRETRHFDNEADKFSFILAVNAHRCPLSQKQKRTIIEAYLIGDPEIADNALGQDLGVSKNTVLSARRRLETIGRIPKVTETKGKDGKMRPVKYAKR